MSSLAEVKSALNALIIIVQQGFSTKLALLKEAKKAQLQPMGITENVQRRGYFF